MANLQLIRSLVLTTLLTALLSLFCRNLYYCIRKWAYKKRKNNRLPISVVRQMSPKSKRKIRHEARKFKYSLLFLLICIIATIIALMVVVMNNSSILLPEEFFDFRILDALLALFLLILFTVIYFAYRNVNRAIASAKSATDTDDRQEHVNDSISTIFVHERDEDEELDRLFDEQMKESTNKLPDESSEEENA